MAQDTRCAAGMQTARSAHRRAQQDFLAGQHETSVATVMQGARRDHRRIVPGAQHLEHEEVVAADQLPVRYPAFEIGIALLSNR